MLLPLLFLLATQTQTTAPAHPQPQEVLLVENANDGVSVQIGEYYQDKRSIPADNVLRLNLENEEEVTYADLKSQILQPIRDQLARLQGIKYIVLTKNIPIRLSDEGGFSVDGQVSMAALKDDELDKANKDTDAGMPNPYYGKDADFDPKKYGFYLVTRLDAFTQDDAIKLIEDSLAAKASKGPFFFDAKPGHFKGGYESINQCLFRAGDHLKKKGYDASVDSAGEFVAPSSPLAGYASWGSNDEHFKTDEYHKLQFIPGALAETFVSTSARTFEPTDDGQSLIGDLIAQGVTGVKGYVSEPYTAALARVDILFDRYTSGYGLAESFYMASPMIKWKDIVIGDPLCDPYAK